MLYEAFLAGIWGSVGSTLGKLAGTSSIVGDGYALSAVILMIMVVVNTWSSRHYLRSLDAAPNSVAPTIISAASSYVLSGFIGIMMFEETSTTQWWAGAVLIITGLTLLARPNDKDKIT